MGGRTIRKKKEKNTWKISGAVEMEKGEEEKTHL